MDKPIIQKTTRVVLDTNFADLFAVPGLFKVQAIFNEFDTKRFEKWVDFLIQSPPVLDVWINAINVISNTEEIYDRRDFKKHGYGTLVARSAALPGVIKTNSHIDGAVSANPNISKFKKNCLTIISQLNAPYRTVPKSRIEKMVYAWEYAASKAFEHEITHYDNVQVVYPAIDDVDSSDFAISKKVKQDILEQAYIAANLQLDAMNFVYTPERKEFCFGVSGGGIRSLANISVLKALLERNYIPIQFSGSSGGALLALLFACWWSEEDGVLI